MIATTIEQSKRLLELGIDPETADMFYYYDSEENEQVLMCYNGFVNDEIPNIPAWSLSALLNLIPKQIIVDKVRFALRMDIDDSSANIWYEELGCGLVHKNADFISTNLIDAAVEAIEWLLKEGYLRKEAEK